MRRLESIFADDYAAVDVQRHVEYNLEIYWIQLLSIAEDNDVVHPRHISREADFRWVFGAKVLAAELIQLVISNKDRLRPFMLARPTDHHLIRPPRLSPQTLSRLASRSI